MTKPHLLFVTGKLAEPALRRTLDNIAARAGFEYDIAVLPITVVALATTEWIARHVQISTSIDEVVLPGLCRGELSDLQRQTPATVRRGPKDLRDLPEFFEMKETFTADYGHYDIEILAEINHAPQLALSEILDQSRTATAAGADVVDLGCDPASTWSAIADAVRALGDERIRVSVDSFNAHEVEAAVQAGAELVLSVNRSNKGQAKNWGCGVVAVPDVPATLEGLDETVEQLEADGVSYRIDPIVEPIGLGFAASLGRYLEVRRRYPHAEIMMGIGNLTELTDVDSAGVNVTLLGFCQEVGIRSVLTTEVINWCRSCVRELDLARRLVSYAHRYQVLPKHLEPNLIMLRDPKLRSHGEENIEQWAREIKDPNLRLFAERGLLYVLNNKMFLRGTDPFDVFDQILEREVIDPSHAFYLGYEMAKAVTALTLNKNYIQDQPLHWGMLTRPEKSHWDKTRKENTAE